MIIGRLTSKDSNDMVLLLGLSKINVARLLAGQPIRIRRETHGEGIPEHWEIVILTGETEDEIAKMFEAAGIIGPDTKLVRDPRLGINPNT